MKAWEIEYNTMAAAQPFIPQHTAENWLKYEEAGNAWDKKLYNTWYNVVPGSEAPCQLVVAAVQAMENRGYDVSEAEKLLEEGLRLYAEKDMMGLNAVTAQIYAALQNAPKNPNSSYWDYTEYTNFEQIEAAVQFADYPAVNVGSDEFATSIHGGWMAQLVGSAVGTQMEGYTTPNIIRTYGNITGYLRPPETYNDDITYELAFLDVFAKKGYAVTSEDIALGWAALIPDGYSAEETALINIRAGIMPPESGRQRNWFSDWIGAQMRTAIHGMAAPGNPRLAASLAWRDSVVSHANNGALGGVFNALLVSLAFVESNVRSLLRLAVGMIPANSEYYAVVNYALNTCTQHQNWQDAWQLMEERFKEYHWIHAYPNAAAEVLALYYGNGNFDETLNIVCLAGRDTDCNAGQIMTVLGIQQKQVAQKWTEELHGTVQTYMRAYKKFTIDELVQKTVKAVREANR